MDDPLEVVEVVLMVVEVVMESQTCEEFGLDSKEDEVVPKVDDVSLVDRVFDGAFGGDGDKDFAIGYRFDKEASVEAMEEEEEEEYDKDGEENMEDDHYLIKR
ncbi:hypothetical protein Tco_0854397 [Tanacetum coccineum]